MSDTDSDDTKVKCSLCGQFVGSEGLVSHLKGEHSDQRETIQQSYGLRMVSNVFDDGDDLADGDDLDVVEIDQSPQAMSHCLLCDDPIVESKGEEPTMSDVGAHLRENHADQRDAIARVFGGAYAELLDDAETAQDADVGEAAATRVDSVSGSDPEITFDSDARGRSRRSSEAGSENGSRESDRATTDSGEQSTGSSTVQRGGIGNKFAVFGVGGAGNHTLDALLMRRDTLQNRDSPLYRAWEGGIQTYLPLNTNNSEVLDTYYAQRDQELDRNNTVQRCVIGFENMAGDGAGEDPIAGIERMVSDIENEPGHTFTRWPFNEEDIARAQAGMFLHSVVKGTGTGATPPLVRYIRDQVLQRDSRYGTPMVSLTILPKERRVERAPTSKYAENCGFGFGRMATEVDLIIPFGNERLERVASDIAPDIEGLDDFGHGHGSLNRPLVQFIEAFMLTSNSELIDMGATESLTSGFGGGGDGFDVPDSFRPVADNYPLDEIGDHKPGVVGAPVFSRLERRSVDESSLRTLVGSALRHGRLVDFEPETAWGAVFIAFGPEDVMKDVATFIHDFQAHDIVLDTVETDDLDVRFHQAVVDEVDNLHLWGLFWNPHMPALESMYEQAREAKELDDHRGREFRKRWDRVEPVFKFLGKENRSS